MRCRGRVSEPHIGEYPPLLDTLGLHQSNAFLTVPPFETTPTPWGCRNPAALIVNKQNTTHWIAPSLECDCGHKMPSSGQQRHIGQIPEVTNDLTTGMSPLPYLHGIRCYVTEERTSRMKARTEERNARRQCPHCQGISTMSGPKLRDDRDEWPHTKKGNQYTQRKPGNSRAVLPQKSVDGSRRKQTA